MDPTFYLGVRKHLVRIMEIQRCILTHLKRTWCWERLRAGEGDNRGWDGWMASPTQWTWVWVGSGNWWWTGRPGVLQFMESQRVRHDWMAELNWCTKHTPSHLHMNTVTFHWFSTNELFTFKDAAKRDF